MNSQEGMDLAKMAVTVLLVILVVGAVFFIAYKAYAWFTSGSDKLGDQVTSIDKSAYSRYDDAQCTGSDVTSALKTYRETDIAIFVCNKSNGGYTDGVSAVNAYNYCAVADGFDAQTAAVSLAYDEDKGGYHFSGYALDSSTNMPKHNTNFSPCSTKSSSETYVKTSAKFYSKLVYDDTTGEVGGIVFMQMN